MILLLENSHQDARLCTISHMTLQTIMSVKVSRSMLIKFMMEQKYIPVRQTSLYNLYKRFGEGTLEPNMIWNASGTWKETVLIY